MLDFSDRWDRFDTFPDPRTGKPLVKWAAHAVGTTEIQVSMCYERIWKEIPREKWGVVMLATHVNAKMGESGGRWVTLIGHGAPNAPVGNLLLYMVKSDRDFIAANPKSPDAEHFARATRGIVLTLKGLGIPFDYTLNLKNDLTGNN